MSQIEERIVAFARLIRTEEDASALRLHVKELLEGPAFTASRRSGQFLQYVIEKAVAHQTGALKERTIGVEVFHRPADYDTGEDAIVRVTASDVRRRLAQHYNDYPRASRFRISLPPGGYAPEIYREPPEHHGINQGTMPDDPASGETTKRTALTSETPPVTEIFPAVPLRPTRIARYTFFTLAAVLLVGAAAFWGGKRISDRPESAHQPLWSLLFTPGKPLLVVMADPDLNEIQLLTGKYVSLSDYAAGRLGCEGLKPDLQPLCRQALRGDKSSTVDVAAVTKVAGLAGRFQSSLETLEARSVRLPDLLAERNILLLGSRVSNPWADLFRDKLDFYVSHDQSTGLQVVMNAQPRAGEAEEYVPTAGPYGSGENYTLISFLHNLSGHGYALILSGATHEGMDAAIGFVTNEDRLVEARRNCGISSEGEPFQMLLKFNMMAGSSLKTTVIACHRLNT